MLASHTLGFVFLKPPAVQRSYTTGKRRWGHGGSGGPVIIGPKRHGWGFGVKASVGDLNVEGERE